MKISGNCRTFLEKNNLTLLIPIFEITTSARGYGDLDEVGTIYGLMWNTPGFVISLGLKALEFKDDPFNIYMLKDGFSNVWNKIVDTEKFDVRYWVKIRNIVRNETIYHPTLVFNDCYIWYQ